MCDIYTMSALWILTGLRNFWSLYNAKKCKLLYNEKSWCWWCWWEKFKFNNIFMRFSFSYVVSQWYDLIWLKKYIQSLVRIKESFWYSSQENVSLQVSICKFQNFIIPVHYMCRYHPTTCAVQKCIMTSPPDKDLLVVRKYCIFVPYIVNFN